MTSIERLDSHVDGTLAPEGIFAGLRFLGCEQCQRAFVRWYCTESHGPFSLFYRSTRLTLALCPTGRRLFHRAIRDRRRRDSVRW